MTSEEYKATRMHLHECSFLRNSHLDGRLKALLAESQLLGALVCAGDASLIAYTLGACWLRAFVDSSCLYALLCLIVCSRVKWCIEMESH